MTSSMWKRCVMLVLQGVVGTVFLPIEGIAAAKNSIPVEADEVWDKHKGEGKQQEVLAEEKGDYPVIERRPSLPLGALQDAWNQPVKASGQSAPGIVRYHWSPTFVMAVRLRDYMTTTVQFPGWEKILTYYVGDPSVFLIEQAQGNVLILRSQNAGADTNFTAIGASGHIYNFYVRSESWNSKQISDFTVYVEAAPTLTPKEAGADMKPLAEKNALPEYLRDIVFKPENMQFDMQVYVDKQEDEAIAPERVWQDGVFTYFDYGEKADQVPRPVIFLVVDGVDTMVNTRSKGASNQVLIAEAVGDFTLRNGTKTVCVKRKKGSTSLKNAPHPNKPATSSSGALSDTHSYPPYAPRNPLRQ